MTWQEDKDFIYWFLTGANHISTFRLNYSHCIKSVRIRSYSGPYLVQMRENTDQNNSEYVRFPRSEHFIIHK